MLISLGRKITFLGGTGPGGGGGDGGYLGVYPNETALNTAHPPGDTAVGSTATVTSPNGNLYYLSSAPAWVDTGTGYLGDMLKAVYDPTNIAANAFARANHTGTQTAATISDFQATVSANTDVAANTSKRHDALTLNADQPTQDGAGLVAQVLQLKLVTTITSGLMAFADKVKLNGIAPNATANQTDAFLLSRANHTGTQTAATISDFASAVTNNAAVLANTAKVTNANHTGDVTGSGALTIALNAVDNTKAADMAQSTIKGRAAGGGTGDPQDLTPAQVKTVLGLPSAYQKTRIYKRACGSGGTQDINSDQVVVFDGNGEDISDAAIVTFSGNVFTLKKTGGIYKIYYTLSLEMDNVGFVGVGSGKAELERNDNGAGWVDVNSSWGVEAAETANNNASESNITGFFELTNAIADQTQFRLTAEDYSQNWQLYKDFSKIVIEWTGDE